MWSDECSGLYGGSVVACEQSAAQLMLNQIMILDLAVLPFLAIRIISLVRHTENL